jgi:hypothetical protein
MAQFFNTTRGPLSFTLTSGQVGSASPKKWTAVADEETGCADIVRLVQQGFLVRKIERSLPKPPAPKAVAPKPVEPQPVKVEAETPVEPPKKRRTRKPVAEVAQSLGNGETTPVE